MVPGPPAEEGNPNTASLAFLLLRVSLPMLPELSCPLPAGPTMRVKAGDTMRIRLRNELIQPEGLTGYASHEEHTEAHNGFTGTVVVTKG